MVNNRDLRALRPQTTVQRFQAVRTLLAGILLVIVATLLTLAQLSTQDSPAIGIAGIVFGVAVIAFSIYQRVSRRRRAAALRKTAASVSGYQLNTTYSQAASAAEVADAVRATPTPSAPSSRSRLLTGGIVVAALVVVLIPVVRALHPHTDLGTVVPVGTAQKVSVTGDDYKKADAAGVAKVEVTSIRRATAGQLSDVQLSSDQKQQTAFFVRYSAKKTSGSFDPNSPGVFSEYNWSAVQSDGHPATTIVTILPPSACQSGDQRDFATAATVEGCQIFLSDTTAELETVSFEESAGTFSWSTAD